MRIADGAVLVAAVAFFSSSAVAAAAPKDYCADLKGVTTGGTCQIQMTEPAYNVNISFPTDYPDQKPVADYIAQTRDGFLNVAKSSAPRDVPYELDISSADYGSAIPPRGTQAVVFKTYENIGAAHPQTSFKAFNWDQSYRKAITYDTLWRVDDPLKTVALIVQSELQKQTGHQVQIAPTAAYDPMNYQDFAVTNDGVMFFFSQGELLPEAAGATQVLVPRAAIDPMLA
jgi:uncharacterized protein DUF3298